MALQSKYIVALKAWLKTQSASGQQVTRNVTVSGHPEDVTRDSVTSGGGGGVNYAGMSGD